VASPVGANLGIVQHGVTGFLADSVPAWRRYLLQLIDDAALRSAMGRSARRIAEGRYDFSAMAPTIQTALQHSLDALQAGRPALPAAEKPYRSPALSYRP
jgi:glycosyltransferase involved in cell wall biosynthesis